MSNREGSNSSKNENQINMFDDVIRWFKRLLVDMEDRMGRQEAWMERLDTIVIDLHRKQCIEAPNMRRSVGDA